MTEKNLRNPAGNDTLAIDLQLLALNEQQPVLGRQDAASPSVSVSELKLYEVKVDGKGSVGYDEYDAFLILAHSPEQAVRLAVKHSGGAGAHNFGSEGFHSVKEVKFGKRPRVLLGSFNAG